MSNKNKKNIYLDYAATTPVDARVMRASMPYFSEKFGNTASLHQFGREAKKALEKSRQTIAEALGARAGKIVFTSSATESNNLALKGGLVSDTCLTPNHLIISAVEHPCVLQSAKWLESQGHKVTYLPVDKHGLVDPQTLKKAITKKTALVSIMHANNEIGTIQPLTELGKICKKAGVLFHTDASQTFGKLPINVKKLNVDLLTASSHKMYGPKGAGLLYIRQGIKMTPLLHGGGHEFDLRASTVNVPAIVGFAKAVEICQKNREKEQKRINELRDKLIKGVLEKIPESYLTGHPTLQARSDLACRLPNNASFWFRSVEGEAIVLLLDSYGIAASTASACASAKLEPSHVLLACGLTPQQAHGSLRLSLGRWTKPSDITSVLSILPKIIKKLRKISPYAK